MTNREDTGTSLERLLVDQLATIERAIRFACQRAALRDQEAEDFASAVKLKLIENDYAILRKHDLRASFAGYIAVVVQRLLLDYRVTQWGKWHASAEAKRLGEPAITIEAMLIRDGRTIEEIVPVLLRRWPDLTPVGIDAIARSLPYRIRRARPVDIEFAADAIGADDLSVHDAAFEKDRLQLSRRVAAIVRETMTELDEHDRLVFRLKFEGAMSIADISRTLRVEQKPLYRRLQRALARIRSRLQRAGIEAEDAHELLGAPGTDFDFGFGSGAVEAFPTSSEREES